MSSPRSPSDGDAALPPKSPPSACLGRPQRVCSTAPETEGAPERTMPRRGPRPRRPSRAKGHSSPAQEARAPPLTGVPSRPCPHREASDRRDRTRPAHWPRDAPQGETELRQRHRMPYLRSQQSTAVHKSSLTNAHTHTSARFGTQHPSSTLRS